MITGKVIVTNNSAAEKKYRSCAEVIMMENAAPYDVFAKAKELLESGARLSNPKIKNPERHYRTLGLFYGDPNAPLHQNLEAIEDAMEATAMTRNTGSSPSGSKHADLRSCRMSTKKF